MVKKVRLDRLKYLAGPRGWKDQDDRAETPSDPSSTASNYRVLRADLPVEAKEPLSPAFS